MLLLLLDADEDLHIELIGVMNHFTGFAHQSVLFFYP